MIRRVNNAEFHERKARGEHEEGMGGCVSCSHLCWCTEGGQQAVILFLTLDSSFLHL
jgi:hypothetical protein